ncbi:hypothetical protein BOKEGFJH_00356 [Chlamydia avium]|uniref:Membrane protein n=2 Tax=Chlamydia avium TaxID=1457141 RepID=W8JQX0_9CHLA|nr:membrane protein [Chlamydia avium]AHK63238.1 Putative membrane protein [Chlamydia avium 10DC88]EPP36658.1 putative membrane protein [Chlamydia psittaci 10_743_SC13]EPP38109.1 putative membrane protein [Chlamydia avium]VVT42840.1 hypothetical protein BOKEGFJH_00356 [Chlamydia avium]
MDKESIENIYKHFRYRFFKFSILPAFLGLLLICTPSILDYHDTAIILSNRICGLLLILLASLSFIHRSVLWLGVFIGMWETMFPCLMKSSSTVFANDTLIGFAIFATVCIPPTRPDPLEVGPTLPEGIPYNPSSGGRRAAVLILSLLGWLQSRYLTASTLGITQSSYESLFFIYPAMMTSYSLLVVLTLSGGERRWHTRPKIVIVTAVTLLSTMVMTLLLITLKHLCPENWLCLSLTIQPAIASVFAYDELRAAFSYLAQFSKKKTELFHLALFGSEYYKESLFWEERTVLPFSKACKQAFLGISFPINLVLSIFLSVICMKSGYGRSFSGTLRNYISMCCWFITVLSILSFAESLRRLRWFCLIFSSAILLSPVFFHIPLKSPFLIPIIILGITLIILPIGKIQQKK